jgi:hypothetical protein
MPNVCHCLSTVNDTRQEIFDIKQLYDIAHGTALAYATNFTCVLLAPNRFLWRIFFKVAVENVIEKDCSDCKPVYSKS